MADKPIRYHGKGFSLRGEKNRLVLPTTLRKDVVASSGGERIVCLTKHPDWDCLMGFGLSHTETFDAWLDSEQERATRLGRDFNRGAMSLALYGYEDLPFDASGRFVLNPDLLEMGKIGDEVYFQGAGEYFTLWAPDQLYAMDSAFEGAKVSCRRLQAEAQKGKRK
ncbi:division/cell wall cluster transcriptional repressor MraZ [Croceibacterium aestuarii]|uniref:division/cell wall cluster transcriptional repressor MraZ n=1 Tax=Croceibacterium aestuarii TaxID=3064139 RepID=UPI00272E8BEC|nr:division/cell wall cluster transcriptional repressor MraZ [Croceibacterium sp. D39]